MQGTNILFHGGVELIDHLGTGHIGDGQRFQPAPIVGVDHDPIRHRPKIGSLARDDDVAEMVVPRRNGGRRDHAFRDAVGAGILERRLPFRGRDLSEPSAGGGVAVRMPPLAEFPDPAEMLVGVVSAIAAVGQRRAGSAGEGQECLIGAFGRTGRIEAPGHGPDARHDPAGEQPDDVDLMGGLAEHDSAAP